MESKNTSGKKTSVRLPYHSIRNISSPEDTAESRTVHSGVMPIQAIVGLPTNENVRSYLVEAEGKQKRVPTQVHRAIQNTLNDYPDRFCVLNGGVVLVARRSEIDEKTKTITLEWPSIINGSQTQGVIQDFLEALKFSAAKDAKVDANPSIHIKFELIVTDDPDLVAEISIARNFQNDVRSISIAGRRGRLDELEERFRSSHPKFAATRLQKSESQIPTDGNDFLATEKLLQVIAALLPPSLWWKASEYNKVYTYSRKATCLKDFQEIYESAHRTEGITPEDSAKFSEIYNFYLDIAGDAWLLYDKWKEHQGFAGSGLRSIIRDGKTIVEVPDGIVFPIIASFAEFVVKTSDGWKIRQPGYLDDRELITAAKSAYMDIAKSKPEIMGKTKACYTALQQITSIYKKLMDRT